MQHAFENLERSVMSEDSQASKIITTQAEDRADAARSRARAESTTRPQLEALIRQLRRDRDSKVKRPNFWTFSIHFFKGAFKRH